MQQHIYCKLTPTLDDSTTYVHVTNSRCMRSGEEAIPRSQDSSPPNGSPRPNKGLTRFRIQCIWTLSLRQHKSNMPLYYGTVKKSAKFCRAECTIWYDHTVDEAIQISRVTVLYTIHDIPCALS